ncbi:MAG: hypothetical protein HON98_08190 [Chloroflexi bacterium]|nr:hypothetical protein [Chloroflexota bacterium]MBT3669924.1 hypothetical protein [Chloroflexota bacterium]MBT4304826.1 hypothetical protein [Chloroflexota bacterium]MBT4534673.1 hypothetical protein [Chloroflexota bacterium]MBT4683756.1 hypothetical protein [Chloroflexota bacterium]
MKKKNSLIHFISLGLIILLILSGCAPSPDENDSSNPASNENTAADNNKTNEVENNYSEEPNADEVIPEEPAIVSNVPENNRHVFLEGMEALSNEPVQIEIPTDDGRTIQGYYYPGLYNPGPILVLMHWAGGDMHDWDVIAPWLQNRGVEPLRYGNDSPWWNPTWFPELPEWASFGVIVFNFGEFGLKESDRDTWVLDAKAAVDFATQLEEASPDQITTMGASIGSDGSPDGCYLHQLDDTSIGTCLGAFSFSPGNYLKNVDNFNFTYAETIEGLVMNPDAEKVAYCLAAKEDYDSPDTCLGAIQDKEEFDRYKVFLYPGGAHGMRLVEPDQFPIEPELQKTSLEIYLMFLEDVYQIELDE